MPETCPKCGGPGTIGDYGFQTYACGSSMEFSGFAQSSACRIAELTHGLSEAVGLLRDRRFIGPGCDVWDIQVRSFLARLDPEKRT